MKDRVLAKHPLIVHPILFGVVPLLALLAENLDQTRPVVALRSGLVVIALCLFTCAVLRLALRSWGMAAPLASLWFVMFYTYGHVYELIEGRSLLGLMVGKHRFLFPLWMILALLGTLLLLRAGRARLKDRPVRVALRRDPFPALNQILNAAALALFLFPLLQIGQFYWRYAQPAAQGQEAAAANPTDPGAATHGAATPGAASPGAESTNPGGYPQPPNIYYIVLDSYARADLMKELYGLDISPFMQDLRSLGFLTPDCAQSNYGLTPFSMYAALNLNYIDAPGSGIPVGSYANEVDTIAMDRMLGDNKVRAFLAARGYQFVTFESGYWWLDAEDAEYFIVGNDNPLEKLTETYEVGNFENIFLRTTALRPLSELAASVSAARKPAVINGHMGHYQRTTFALEQLEKVSQIPGKKFVYFHLIAPHAPFVFDEDGSFKDWDTRKDLMTAYPIQVKYLNRRVLEIVRGLLAAEEVPPVIILQSDHAWDPRPENRMRILNALYLPGISPEAVQPDHTPVNTFRLVLSHYFGADLPLLENRSYFSLDGDAPQYNIRGFPYRPTEVPITCMSR